MRRKPRSIRSKIVLALLVPVVALTGLWVIDVKASFADATALRDTYNTRDNVSLPCDRMVAALQAERTQSAEFLATPDGDAGALRTQRAATDAAIAHFRELSRRYRGSGVSSEITRARIADMASVLRPWSNDPGLINRYLSCGAGGISPRVWWRRRSRLGGARRRTVTTSRRSPPGA